MDGFRSSLRCRGIGVTVSSWAVFVSKVDHYGIFFARFVSRFVTTSGLGYLHIVALSFLSSDIPYRVCGLGLKDRSIPVSKANRSGICMLHPHKLGCFLLTGEMSISERTAGLRPGYC